MILPVKYPVIATNTWHACLLSIIGCIENSDKWIYENYIHLYSYVIKNNIFSAEKTFADFYPGTDVFYKCPFIKLKLISKKQIDEDYQNNFLQFVIDSVESGNYIYCVFNEQMMLNSANVMKHH